MPLSRYISEININIISDVAVKVITYVIYVGLRRPIVTLIKLIKLISRAKSVLNKFIVKDII